MKNNQRIYQWLHRTARQSAWAPISVFVIYFIAYHLDAYQVFPPLDIPTHFMGGLAITHFFLSAISNSQSLLGSIPDRIQSYFAFTCTGTSAIFWEFIEFSIDISFNTNHVRGVEDIIQDLFLGLLGSMVYLLFLRKKKPV